MASIRDLFTFYLKADDLRGRTVIATVESAKVEEVFNTRRNRTEPRLLVRFVGKKLALACNKTQATAIMGISGTEHYDRWPKTVVALSPGKSHSGKDTIVISQPAAAGEQPAPPPVPVTLTQTDAGSLFGDDDE